MRYWFDILANPDSERKPRAFYRSIHEYLTGYHFVEVLSLLDRLDYDVKRLA